MMRCYLTEKKLMYHYLTTSNNHITYFLLQPAYDTSEHIWKKHFQELTYPKYYSQYRNNPLTETRQGYMHTYTIISLPLFTQGKVQSCQTNTHAHKRRHLTDKDLHQKISVFERLFCNSMHQHLVSDPIRLCSLGWNQGSKGFRRISLPFHKSKLSRRHQCDRLKCRKGQQQ